MLSRATVKIRRVSHWSPRVMSAQRERSEEDAKGDREHGALAEKGARTTGDSDWREGYEIPGGQLHTWGISGVDVELLSHLHVGELTTPSGREPNFYR